MNNNSIKINSYLQQEMSAEERAAFEAALLTDTELQYELKVQQHITDAAYNAGLKATFAKAMHKKLMTTNIVKCSIIIIVCATAVFIFRKTIFQKRAAQHIAVQTNRAFFINPPQPGINVPFTEYSFDAEKGDTLFSPTGAVILMPASALTDEAGNLIKGMVKVRYREFFDPVDFFLSGIPMQYDSAGKTYNFESSGMCELTAYQNGKTLFVNQNAKPEVFLSVSNKNPEHNLYYLDTVKRAWVNEGKDLITELKKNGSPKAMPAALESNTTLLPLKPVMPLKASEGKQSFSIAIDPGSFEELFAYDKLKFEVADNTPVKQADADEHWDDVKLQHGSVEGIYIITFTNGQRSLSYKVRPVLEGADYNAALKIFNEKNRAYEDRLKNRLKTEADQQAAVAMQIKKEAETDSLNRETERINRLVAAGNKKLQEMRALIMKEIEEQQKANAQIQKEQELWLSQNAARLVREGMNSQRIIRSFEVNNFGVWNCDHPQYPKKEIYLYAKYKTGKNEALSFSSAAVVYKGLNGITEFSPASSVRVIPGAENMIWGFRDSVFYYFTYQDFMDAKIPANARAITFTMRQSPGKVSSYEEVRNLVTTFTVGNAKLP